MQTQSDKLKQLNEHVKAKLAKHSNGGESLRNESADDEQQQQWRRKSSSLSRYGAPGSSAASGGERRFRSRRELIDLTVLDRVQKQIRSELEENMKNLRKFETQSEFNSIVSRIYDFLAASSSSSSSSSPNATPIAPAAAPRTNVRVYKIDLFKS